MTTNTLIEKANKSVVDTLSTISYKRFLNILSETEWCYECKDVSFEENYKEQFNLIKTYCSKIKKNGYSMSIKYSKSVKQPTGRVYADGGIQNIWSLFRNALISDIYYDFDMVNAHPTILLHICKEKKIRSNELDYYVNNRERCLDELIDTDGLTKREAKNLYIASINDETKKLKFKKKKIKYEKFLKFDAEIKSVQKELADYFPIDWKEIKRKNRDTENRYGKLVSRLCCELENNILQDVIKHNKPSVLMFDGFLIDQNDVPNVPNFIKILNKKTKKYGINWIEKEIDATLIDVITDTPDEAENVSIVEDTLNDIAKELHSNYLKDKLYRCNNTVYSKLNGRWIADEKKQVFTELFNDISLNLDLWVYSKESKKSVAVNSDKKPIDDLIAFIINTTPIDNNFIHRIWNHTINKLYFKNGVYDFKTGDFEESDGNTFISIDYDLHFDSNPEIREEIYSRILNPIFTCYEDRDDYKTRCELRDYFVYYIARACAGDITDKNWAVITGERNCGKSLFIDFIKNVFKDYCGVSVGKQLVYQDRLGDCAKELSWLMSYQFKRFLLMSELPVSPTKKKITFDGNKIKMISSGGDEIEVRQNYTNEINIKLQANLICAFNDAPDCTPTDALDTCKTFECITKFVDDSEKKQFSNIKYLPKDDTVKTKFIYDKAVINEFMLMLIDAYKTPTEYPEKLAVEYNNDNETDVDKLLNLFEITKNSNDFLSNQAIMGVLEENNCFFKLKKAKQYLIGIGGKTVMVRQDNKTVRGLSGIRFAC